MGIVCSNYTAWNVLHGEYGFGNFYGMKLFSILIACEVCFSKWLYQGGVIVKEPPRFQDMESFLWASMNTCYCELRDEFPIEI